MSCNINNYSIRRKLLVVSAALVSAAVTTTSTQAVAATTHDAAHSTTSLSSSQPSLHPNNHYDNHSKNNDATSPTTTVPTFSCGTHWQSATQCNQLCIDGDDSSCPPGQYCYAGIPCSKSSVEESAIMRMEMELMERLIWERDNNISGWKGFVCGVSFQEAESSCSGDHSVEVHYCNSGQSSECPSNMQCYASVACSSGNTIAPAPTAESSTQQKPKPVTPISFSSPTANVTPIIHHEEGDGDDDDDASLSYSYSFHNIVGTMSSRLLSSLGALSHS